MAVKSIDHVALPIIHIDAMRHFYEAFGFAWDESAAPHLYAVTLTEQKLNFHAPVLWENRNFTLRGPSAKPGCGDFCFRWEGGRSRLQSIFDRLKLVVIEGPVTRQGGAGSGTSFYVRDPDENLVEFICYSD